MTRRVARRKAARLRYQVARAARVEGVQLICETPHDAFDGWTAPYSLPAQAVHRCYVTGPQVRRHGPMVLS